MRGRRQHSKRTVFQASVVAAVLLLALAFAAFTLRGDDAAAVRPQPNLLANGSFERSLDGWSGINARLTRIRGGAAGRAAARVTVVPGASDFSIFSTLHLDAAPGRYTASGWVRSPRRLPVCLRIREWSGDTVVGSAQRCVRPRTRWVRFPAVRLRIAAPARQVDVYAYRVKATRGSRFDVDGISLVGGAVRLPPLPAGGPTTLIAAGDIAACGRTQDDTTARMLERIRGTIATLGDNVYENGTREEFARCYQPAWGRLKSRTRPSPGNHDYHTRGAAPYYAYFGAAAGPRGRGYYSYSVGTWHVIALNSNCGAVGGCGAGSPQERWLRADLQAHRTHCTLAYWHHPRFSSGMHGDDDDVHRFWQVLYDAGADVILNGHDHNYERFAPQAPTRARDRARGIRQFVVGTGGADLRPFRAPVPNSEVRNSDTHGVLVMTLRPGDYSWRFVPVPGRGFTDSGSDSCH